MADEPDRKLLDKRVAQRYVRKGVLDEKDYDKHLKSLPDLADQAVPVESDLEASAELGIDDEDDEEEEGGDEGPPAGGGPAPQGQP